MSARRQSRQPLRVRIKKKWEANVKKGAVRSVLARSLVEFFGALVLSVIFCQSIFFGPFHYLLTAAAAAALTYSIYPFSGGFINSNVSLFSFISGADHKLGKTTRDRIVSLIAYFIVHVVGAFLGAIIASELLNGGVPAAPTWTGGPAAWFVPFFAEVVITMFYLLIVGAVTDYTWATEETVVLRGVKESAEEEVGVQMRRYQQMNGYYGIVVFFARFALGSVLRLVSGGVLNADIGTMANVWAAIRLGSGTPMASFGFYLVAHLLAAILSGFIYRIVRVISRRHMFSKKMGGQM